MDQFTPGILFSDFYGSAGDVTAYHLDGKCHIRKRACSPFPATQGQQSCLAVHRRALAAWRMVPHEVQKLWNSYAINAEPHKPPFDHSSHISGNNLFVSAYHGFATLGNEHIPEPLPFEPFPPFAVFISGAAAKEEELRIFFDLTVSDPENRYRLLTKIQLAAPGAGRHPGKMRNYLAERAGEGTALVRIPNFRVVSGLDSDEYQVHAKCILLDTKTGYRSQCQSVSGLIAF